MRGLLLSVLVPSALLAQTAFTNPDFEASGTLGQTPTAWTSSQSVAGAGYRAVAAHPIPRCGARRHDTRSDLGSDTLGIAFGDWGGTDIGGR